MGTHDVCLYVINAHMYLQCTCTVSDISVWFMLSGCMFICITLVYKICMDMLHVYCACVIKFVCVSVLCVHLSLCVWKSPLFTIPSFHRLCYLSSYPTLAQQPVPFLLGSWMGLPASSLAWGLLSDSYLPQPALGVPGSCRTMSLRNTILHHLCF